MPTPIQLTPTRPQSPRFGQLYKVTFKNAPPLLHDDERLALLRRVEADIQAQMPRRHYLADWLKGVQAHFTHPSKVSGQVSNVFFTPTAQGEIHQYIVMGKHRAKLLQFIQNRVLNFNRIPAVEEMLNQWLVNNPPSQTLNVRLVHDAQNQWQFKELKTQPELPKTLQDIWQDRW